MFIEDQLLNQEVAEVFFAKMREQTKGLMSDEHFTVDGTLIEAWASHKSFSGRIAMGIQRMLKYRNKAGQRSGTRLAEFGAKWDAKYPMIAKSWHSNWTHVIPFFAFSLEIRCVIYTANAIESLNMSLRKITKACASFPNETVFKLLCLALRNIAMKWKMPVQDWKLVLNLFAIIYAKPYRIDEAGGGEDSGNTTTNPSRESPHGRSSFKRDPNESFCLKFLTEVQRTRTDQKIRKWRTVESAPL